MLTTTVFVPRFLTVFPGFSGVIAMSPQAFPSHGGAVDVPPSPKPSLKPLGPQPARQRQTTEIRYMRPFIRENRLGSGIYRLALRSFRPPACRLFARCRVASC